jgi:hypothetical protein
MPVDELRRLRYAVHSGRFDGVREATRGPGQTP